MKRQRKCALALVALWALSASAVVPLDLPEIVLGTSPTNPSSSDSLSLNLTGIWLDGCTPEGLEIHILDGDSIWVDLLLPGWNTKGDCEPLICPEVLTPWELTDTLGPLPTGTYDVFARAVGCQESGSYEQISVFQVALGDGDSPFPAVLPGQRVVLLQDEPPAGPGLRMGQAGTVICCDPSDCTTSILVSWDLWADGKADLSPCPEADSLLYPPGSAIWIDPQQVLLGQHFNLCGTVWQGLEGCIFLETGDGKSYNLVASGELYVALDSGGPVQFGDQVRVQGLFNATPPGPGVIRLCPQRDGDIYHPILSPCPLSEPKPGPDEIIIGLGDNLLVLVKDPQAPSTTYAGCTNLSLELNFPGQLSAEVTPAVGVSGTWSATLDPEILGPGSVTTQLCVKVEDLDLSTLPQGNDVQIASVSLFVVPAP